jgi:hypothetical protein
MRRSAILLVSLLVAPALWSCQTTESGELAPVIPPAQQLELARVAIEIAAGEYEAHLIASGENVEERMAEFNWLLELVDLALETYIETGFLVTGEEILNAAEIAYGAFGRYVDSRDGLTAAQKSRRMRRANGLLGLLRVVFWSPAEPSQPSQPSQPVPPSQPSDA